MMQVVKNKITRPEYLEFDESSPEKHEFYDGQIFAVSGGTFNHSRIGLNIGTTLSHQLRGKSCQPMNNDMRIQTPAGLDTYPDISVFCGDPELSDNDRTLHNPVVIFEVLSPTTQNYDRGDKFWHYRSIPVLQDYLLVDSESIAVEHYHRQTNVEWFMHEYRPPEDMIRPESPGIVITLESIYEAVKFRSQC